MRSVFMLMLAAGVLALPAAAQTAGATAEQPTPPGIQPDELGAPPPALCHFRIKDGATVMAPCSFDGMQLIGRADSTRFNQPAQQAETKPDAKPAAQPETKPADDKTAKPGS